VLTHFAKKDTIEIQGVIMSVRATERLVGDIVKVSRLSKSPLMVVHSVDIEAKMVATVWFADDGSAQEAEFPATCLDRAEEKPAAKAKKK
jgi:hypothetical protein